MFGACQVLTSVLVFSFIRSIRSTAEHWVLGADGSKLAGVVMMVEAAARARTFAFSFSCRVS